MYLGHKSSASSAVRPHRRSGPAHASCFAALRGRGLERHDRRDEERPVAEGAATDRVEESGHRPTRHFALIKAGFTDATIRAAIRNGLDETGKPLKDAMPRWQMSDPDLNAAIAYLKVLGAQ